MKGNGDEKRHKKPLLSQKTILNALKRNYLPIAILTIFTFGFLGVYTDIKNQRIRDLTSKAKKNESVESLWSPEAIKERELYYKKQASDREEYWRKQKLLETEEKQTSLVPLNTDTKVASIILSVSCAGSKGLIPRNQMGGTMKEMFAEAGIDATQVYSNWDYYWGIAKEMDAYNKTYCLRK